MCVTFGQSLRRIREAAGITQEKLAGWIGENQQTISNWEAGVYEPSISKLKRLAKLFGITVNVLLGC